MPPFTGLRRLFFQDMDRYTWQKTNRRMKTWRLRRNPPRERANLSEEWFWSSEFWSDFKASVSSTHRFLIAVLYSTRASYSRLWMRIRHQFHRYAITFSQCRWPAQTMSVETTVEINLWSNSPTSNRCNFLVLTSFTRLGTSRSA